MARYIDAEKMLVTAVKDKKFILTKQDALKDEVVVKTVYEDLAEFINSQPTADVVEVKHAQIVRNERNIAKMKEFHEKGIGLEISEKSIFWTCSECGNLVKPYAKWCSECGADMRGGKNDL